MKRLRVWLQAQDDQRQWMIAVALGLTLMVIIAALGMVFG